MKIGMGAFALVLATVAVVDGQDSSYGQTFEWLPVLTELPSVGVARLAAHPVSPDTAWACFGSIPCPAEETPDGSGCWRTDDWGEDWALLSDGACTGDLASELDRLCTQDNVLDLAVCPTDGEVLAAAVHGKGFFRSLDGGLSWANISSGLAHEVLGTEPGHCETTAHGPYTFGERIEAGRPWTGTTVTFDPADGSCDTLWVGVADISVFDVVDYGDHPGVYRTIDGGITWTARNGGDYQAAQADLVSCHPLELRSRSAAPSSIRVSGTGPVLMAVADIHYNGDLFGERAADSRLRIFSLEDASDLEWREHVHEELEATRIEATTSTSGLFPVSVSYGKVSASSSGLSVAAATHTGFTELVTAASDVTEFTSESRGIVAGLVSPDGSVNWLARDDGIPSVTDVYNQQAQNVSAVALPASGNTWFVGVVDSDGAPPIFDGNDSFGYGAPNVGSSWLNTSRQPFNPNCSLCSSPTQGLVESSMPAVIWNADSTKLLAMVQWYDSYDPLNPSGVSVPYEPDHGIYRACPFNEGGDC